jgi:hypothetical protein
LLLRGIHMGEIFKLSMLKYSSFNTWRMIRFKTEVVASVSRFSISFSGQCGPFLTTRTPLKGNVLLDSISKINSMEELTH